MNSIGSPQDLDVESLFARVCRPDRPLLEPVLAALEGIDDPREAIERLAARSLVPLDWVESRARAFGGEPDSPQLLPRTVAHVVALAADPKGVLSSEAIAREFLARARVWCELPSPEAPICWRFDDNDVRLVGARSTTLAPFPPGISALTKHALSGAQLALLREELEDAQPEIAREQSGGWIRRLRGLFSSPRSTKPANPFALWDQLTTLAAVRGARALEEAIEDHRSAWLFATLASSGRGVPASVLGPERVSPSLGRRPLRSLDNYFEPLAALWWTGYAVHAVTADRIELVCPSIA